MTECILEYSAGRHIRHKNPLTQDFRCCNKSVVLTDFVHGCIEGFQFGAAGQEVRRNILHTVLAHIKQPDLWQALRYAQLSYTVTEKKKKVKLTITQSDINSIKVVLLNNII